MTTASRQTGLCSPSVISRRKSIARLSTVYPWPEALPGSSPSCPLPTGTAGHQWMVFLSYDKDVKGHPENKDVRLRILSVGGDKKIQVLANLFGGQGTINVPSWSPDSKQLAFVSYQLIAEENNGTK